MNLEILMINYLLNVMRFKIAINKHYSRKPMNLKNNLMLFYVIMKCVHFLNKSKYYVFLLFSYIKCYIYIYICYVDDNGWYCHYEIGKC